MKLHEKINYIELPASDFEGTKTFFGAVFGWQMETYGSDYLAFSDVGIDGGFYRSDNRMRADAGSALVIFYSADLEGTMSKIESAGGIVTRPTFDFPGGRRFHFLDPNGNEYAVWSDRTANDCVIE